MKAASERQFIRILHLTLSIPIVGYIYGPVASIPQVANEDPQAVAGELRMRAAFGFEGASAVPIVS